MRGGRWEKPSRTSGFLALWVDDGHKCSAPMLRVGDCSPPPSLGSLGTFGPLGYRVTYTGFQLRLEQREGTEPGEAPVLEARQRGRNGIVD